MTESSIILIVDGISKNRATLYDFLVGLGYRVLVAETGETAVEITTLVTPKVVLLNTSLPGINGFETCRKIKSQPHGKDIHVIFVSEENNSESRTESFKSGGQAYLLKPIIYDELYNLVETHVKLAEYMQAANGQSHSQKQNPFEIDSIINMVAHDINSLLMSILGFLEELSEDFNEADNIPEHWFEYLSIFKKSSTDIEVIVKALVLLKNLRTRKPGKPVKTSLLELITNVSSRYENLENILPLKLKHTLKVDSILSDPILLEELLLMIWQILSNLNAEKGDVLSLQVSSLKGKQDRIQFSISAGTRQISEEELPKILKPISNGKRQKIKDTTILTVCIQKIIEFLAIEGWAERTEEGLRINLSFAAS